MEWSNKWGKSISSGFYSRLLQQNKIREEDLEPVGIEYFSFYTEAFCELSTCRNESSHPIPFTAIAEYVKIYNIVSDFEDFIYIIRKMDDAFIGHQQAKQKAKDKQEDSKDGSKDNTGKNFNNKN